MEPRKDPKLLGILDPLPDDWPRTGRYLGHAIDLNVARATLTPAQLGSVVVDVPGIGPYQPWKGSDFEITPDGKVRI